MQGRCRLIVFAAAAACLLTFARADAGGLPAPPERAPEAETAPEPAEPPVTENEIEEDFGFPEEFTEPEIEDFTIPREEPETPAPAPSRFRIMFVLLAAAAAAVGLLHYFKKS